MNEKYLKREGGKAAFNDVELKKLRNLYDRIRVVDIERIDREVPRFAKELQELKKGKHDLWS